MLYKALWDQNYSSDLSANTAEHTGAASLLALAVPPKWILIWG